MSCPRCGQPVPNMVNNHKCPPVDWKKYEEAVKKIALSSSKHTVELREDDYMGPGCTDDIENEPGQGVSTEGERGK